MGKNNTALISEKDFPNMIRVRQRFESAPIADIPEEINRQFKKLEPFTELRKDQSVAVACSSRGIANYGNIVKTVVEQLKRSGLRPFVIPAMGSHGSATAAGQKKVLEHLGITEALVGAPVHSSLDVVQIGKTKEDVPVYLDKLAAQADHIVLINRIKKHTDFEHKEFESGLLKMMAIGLGKQKGAATYHQAMLTHGYPKVIFSVAEKVLEGQNILFGVGVVEDGYAQTAQIGIARAAHLVEMEKDLFKVAKRLSPRLPFEDADILIIDEIGKEISGSGFDTKVVGRIGLPLLTKDPETPRIKRIVTCDLTDASDGNAVGVGVADFITQRLLKKIDVQALAINTITGVCPEMGKIPVALENDREALEVAIKCVGLIPVDKLRIMRIKNTARLSEIDISEGYKEDLSQRTDLEIARKEGPMIFDSAGNFPPF
ncbi:MAG: lactate racemase domain-containing protein [Deltaproteobacteria bacterium]